MGTQYFTCKEIDKIEAVFASADARAEKARRLLLRLEDAYQAESRARSAALDLSDEAIGEFERARSESERLESLVAGLRAELEVEGNDDLPEVIFQREIGKALELTGLFAKAADAKVKALEKLKPSAREGWSARVLKFMNSGSGARTAEQQANLTAEGQFNNAVGSQVERYSGNPVRRPTRQNLKDLKLPLPSLDNYIPHP